MDKKPNIAHSEFPGFNTHRGIMLCGYEWGHTKEEQEIEKTSEGKGLFFDENAICTFSNQAPRYGDRALSWKYQKMIKKWFEMWGCPLDSNGLGQPLDKKIVQTNWMDTQGHNTTDSGNGMKLSQRLISEHQVKNFLFHIEYFKPKLILLLGRELIAALNNDQVKPQFEAIVGKASDYPEVIQGTPPGTRFKIFFQDFVSESNDSTHVVCLPHPSGSRGVKDSYMLQFKDRMYPLLSGFVE